MTWFKVDDKFHSHSKVRKVLAEAPSALALWVVAGSWSSDALTDGYVPDHQLPWLIPDGAEEMAQMLVTARLWRRVRGGYLFHEWESDGDGTKRNPTREEVEALRRAKAEAGRKGGLARGKAASASGNESSKTQARARAPAEAPANGLLDPPTRPDPTLRGGPSGSATHARARDAPPPRCPDHIDNPDPPPCGRCADARRAREAWETDRDRRVRDAPQCRLHRGQPAGNCALCRSEVLAALEEP